MTEFFTYQFVLTRTIQLHVNLLTFIKLLATYKAPIIFFSYSNRRSIQTCIMDEHIKKRMLFMQNFAYQVFYINRKPDLEHPQSFYF